MLTRPQFDAACKALVDKCREVTTEPVAASPLREWSWNEHPNYPNFGYMSRTVNIFSRPHGPASGFDDLLSDTVYEEPDPSAALTISGHDQALICQQYVVFSATFRVPAFYFTVCRVSGAPLPLGEIMETSLFKMGACDGFETSSCAVSLPTSTFPVLSHGDHPTLGTPCWYFHPCETTSVIDELMREVLDDGWDEITRLIRWLELWFMVVCSVVNL